MEERYSRGERYRRVPRLRYPLLKGNGDMHAAMRYACSKWDAANRMFSSCSKLAVSAANRLFPKWQIGCFRNSTIRHLASFFLFAYNFLVIVITS